MLIRITGPNFVAGVVFDEADDEVRVAAPIVRWAVGLSAKQLRVELAQRGLTATVVRTLTGPEMRRDVS
jgi:hypothetical protein